ncbi:MAG: endo alpha-1,4 polygalactosaminidase [Clostridiales bacterium]|nr:endo alpha-1,4 polygalactosaminidase [Clostridiales bacterium]
MKSRILALILATASLFSLAGCGSSDKEKKNKRTKRTKDEPSVVTTKDLKTKDGDDDDKTPFSDLKLSEKYLVGFRFSTNDIFDYDPYVTVRYRYDKKVEMEGDFPVGTTTERRVLEFDIADEQYDAVINAIDLKELYTLDPEELDPQQTCDGGYSYLYLYGDDDQILYSSGGFCPMNDRFGEMLHAVHMNMPSELFGTYEQLKNRYHFQQYMSYCNYGVFLSDDIDVNAITGYQLLVVDAQYLSAEDIATLKRNNMYILSYINVGSIESFRPYYDEYADLTLGDYEHWEEEKWMDVSNTRWQSFILEQLAPELLEKGIDGFFVDNCDVYYQYQTDEMLSGLATIMKGLMAMGNEVIINGGDVFMDAYTSKMGEWSDVITGINQEMVFTYMDWDNNMLRARVGDCDEMKYYKEYIEKYADLGAYIFLLEYTDNAGIEKRVQDYCLDKPYFNYYISDSLELD